MPILFLKGRKEKTLLKKVSWNWERERRGNHPLAEGDFDLIQVSSLSNSYALNWRTSLTERWKVTEPSSWKEDGINCKYEEVMVTISSRVLLPMLRLELGHCVSYPLLPWDKYTRTLPSFVITISHISSPSYISCLHFITLFPLS